VPRFHLHVTDGQKIYEDRSGVDLIDGAAAKAFAHIIANDLRPEGQYESYYVDVQDESGNHLAKVFVTPRHLKRSREL